MMLNWIPSKSNLPSYRIPRRVTNVPQWDFPPCTPMAPNQKSLPSPFWATSEEEANSTMSHHLTDMPLVMRRVALALDAELLARLGIRPEGVVCGVMKGCITI